MAVTIPDNLVRATHLSEVELRVEIATMLFASERLTLGQASELAGIPQEEMMRLLGDRGIPLHYDVAELESDLKTLDELRQRDRRQ